METQEEKQKHEGSSASSSPSHEFSFTLSLHPMTTKNKNPPPFAIDLSPADEIFFHGHLLPLHLLSHLPVSPRTSTNSLDSFTLPIHQLSENTTSTSDDQYIDHPIPTSQESSLLEGKGRGKSKSFSLFGWKKGCKENQEEGQKRKPKLDMVKRYMRLIKPFLSFTNRRGDPQIHRQHGYSSFSGNLQVKNKKELRGRRGEFSAPVSMKTSPTNSGLLVATGTLTPNTNDSTMEELQAAIQAAITHCKNSIAAEDKNIHP